MKQRKQTAEKKTSAKKLVEKAEMAIKHEFYLEAIWIVSAAFERKLVKILDLLQPSPQRPVFTFTRLLQLVKKLNINTMYPGLSTNFNEEILDEIREWKNQRNEMLKDLSDIHVSQARLRRLATQGFNLFREFSVAVKSLKQSENITAPHVENYENPDLAK